MSTLLQIILTTGFLSLISFIGLLVLSQKFLKKNTSTTLFVSFAAGVLLSTAVINILPEAFEGMPTSIALRWFLFGIVGSFFLERFLLWYHHHHEDTHDLNPTATLVIFGDAIHNFIDGLAVAAAFIANPALGITATIAIAAHEIPQEISDFSVLRHTGLSIKKALTWNFISALTAVVGGIAGFYIFSESFSLLYIALALTSGIFLYVAVADLIPELHHSKTTDNKMLQSLVFVLGIVLMMVITVNAPHTHEHDADHDQKPYDSNAIEHE